MAKSVTVASALGWVGICTGWNEVEIVWLICTAGAPEVGQINR